MGSRLSESELQRSLDFCVQLFNPTSPEHHERLSNDPKIGKQLLDVTVPLMNAAKLEEYLRHQQSFSDDTSENDSPAADARMVLNKVNARKVVHAEYSIHNLASEPLIGFAVRLETGMLGLSRTT